MILEMFQKPAALMLLILTLFFTISPDAPEQRPVSEYKVCTVSLDGERPFHCTISDREYEQFLDGKKDHVITVSRNGEDMSFSSDKVEYIRVDTD